MISTGKAKPQTSNQLRAGMGATGKAAAAGSATGSTPPAIPAVRHGGPSGIQRVQPKAPVTTEEILNVTPQFKAIPLSLFVLSLLLYI